MHLNFCSHLHGRTFNYTRRLHCLSLYANLYLNHFNFSAFVFRIYLFLYFHVVYSWAPVQKLTSEFIDIKDNKNISNFHGISSSAMNIYLSHFMLAIRARSQRLMKLAIFMRPYSFAGTLVKLEFSMCSLDKVFAIKAASNLRCDSRLRVLSIRSNILPVPSVIALARALQVSRVHHRYWNAYNSEDERMEIS